MDKKNIDELFREKFKTFREVPDEKVWTNIENSLDKKRKRRVIPFWWPLGGVAAVLAIALFTFYTSNDSNDENPIITDTEQTNNKQTKQGEPSIITNDEKTTSKDSKQDDADTTVNQNKNDALQIPEITEDAVAGSADSKDSKNTEGYGKDGPDGVSAIRADTDTLPKTLLNTDVAEVEVTSQKEGAEKGSDTIKDLNNRSPEKIKLAANQSESDGTEPNRDYKRKSDGLVTAEDKENVLSEGNTIAIHVADTDTLERANTPEVGNKEEMPDGIAVNRESRNIVPEATDSAIAQNNQIGKEYQGNDTIVKTNKKSIFEAIEAQNEEEEIAEESGSRWSAGPNVAPVYFDALGEGSPIDPGFSPNAKSGSTNMSYGISIAYAVTKKLSVRSGIHKAEYGYDTKDVGFSPTLTASSAGRLQNIDYAGGAENLALNSSLSDAASPESFAPEVNALNGTRDGNVSQQFGYLEVPLELDYALLDSRFGVNLVGGVSSLFLINNSITLSSDELTTEIGEARNLNDVNFSTNVGFGVNYKFTPKIQLNVEPVFKYQLNTFSNVSGDFKPFSIGVYSGLNFKF